MKTTMSELFDELIKDNTPVGASMPGMDLDKLAREMDKKLDKLMEQNKEPEPTPEPEAKAAEEAEQPEPEPEAAEPEEPGESETE